MNTLRCPKAHVIACDLDDSLVATKKHSEQSRRASDEALLRIGALVTNLRAQSSQPIYFGSATGRTFESIQELAAERPAFDTIFRMMDFHIASVGTAIHAGVSSNFRRISSWPRVDSWDRETIIGRLPEENGLTLQEPIAQDTHKVSYLTTSTAPTAEHAAQLRSQLGDDLQADVIVSGGGSWRFVDVLPTGINKGSALLQLPQLLQEQEPISADRNMSEICRIAVGDSMNDREALAAADVSIMPHNSQPDLLEWAAGNRSTNIFYHTDEDFAAGVLQGLQWHLYGS